MRLKIKFWTDPEIRAAYDKRGGANIRASSNS